MDTTPAAARPSGDIPAPAAAAVPKFNATSLGRFDSEPEEIDTDEYFSLLKMEEKLKEMDTRKHSRSFKEMGARKHFNSWKPKEMDTREELLERFGVPTEFKPSTKRG